MTGLFLPALLLFLNYQPANAAGKTAEGGVCGSAKIELATKDQTNCLPQEVCTTLQILADGGEFGTVSVVSGRRPAADNARRGGAKHSLHITCQAADVIFSNVGEDKTRQRALREKLGQLKANGIRVNVYCSGRTHIDNSRTLHDDYSSCVGTSKPVAYHRAKARRRR